MALLGVIVYVAALYLCGTLGEDAQEAIVRDYFKSMPDSLHFLFIIMTTSNWADMVEIIYETEGWGYALFFDLYIVLTNFTIMNVGDIVLTNVMG